MNHDTSLSLDSEWSINDLRSVWDQLQPQVTPFVRVLNIDGNVYRALDGGAKRFIAHSFMLVHPNAWKHFESS